MLTYPVIKETVNPQGAVTKLATWGTATSTLLAAGQVQAASELTQAAATVNDAAAKVGDNRTAILLALLLPALGWVTYNIAGAWLLCS